jgi:pimeloyl-ACP methyl ester carboxylesterase
MQPPRTRYAKSGDVSIAYQVIGDAPLTLVYAPGWISRVEVMWEDPHFSQFITRLAAFARVVMFDKRGTGASDRDGGYPTLDDRMDDIRAVMDAVGVERAALFGVSEGGNMSTMFAATYPERVSHLILFGCFAKRSWSEDYPLAPTPEKRQDWIDTIVRDWDKTPDLAEIAPSRVSDPVFAEWFGRMARMAASPGSAKRLAELNTQIDVRGVLPAACRLSCCTTSATTTRAWKRGATSPNTFPALALSVSKASITYPGLAIQNSSPARSRNSSLAYAAAPPAIRRSRRSSARILWALLRAARHWAMRIGASSSPRMTPACAPLSDAAKARKSTPPAMACLRRSTAPAARSTPRSISRTWRRSLDLPVRAGVHTGECQRVSAGVSGIAVDIAVRVANHADAAQVYASRTVRDLTIGAGFAFEDAGTHALKGAPGQWQLLRVRR